MNVRVRVFEAFAGYGSQSMALRRLAEDYPRFSFEVVGISEMTATPCKPTAPFKTAAGSRADDNYVFDKAYVSYTRDAKGKVIRRHFKDIANTVHTSTGQGGNTDGYVACAVRGRGDGNRQTLEVGGSVANAITSVQKDSMVTNGLRIRKLSERECFRLMDLSESDIDKIQAAGISRTQQYKMAGNSIVVAVLYHIFRKMFIQPECETKQLKLF